jgi:hypothetical protein
MPGFATAVTLSCALRLVSQPAITTQDQNPHSRVSARGAAVMGFDQDKTAHHFVLYEDGGAIEVSVKDETDAADRDAIRAHLPHIAMMFGQGSFDAPMLVHDSRHVPGTAVMTQLKNRIRYRYSETPAGGRVDIVAKDPAAVAAVHDFLRFQIDEHKTGDPLTVRRR